MPKFTLPFRLPLLVAGTLLPVILFASGVIYRDYQKDREQASAQVLQTVRSIRIALDGEIQRMIGNLQVLARTNSLRAGNFDAFRNVVQGVLDQYPPGSVVLVANRDGQQVFSSLSTDTANLPRRNNRDVVAKVFETGKPATSDLFVGSLRKLQIVTVEVPVIIDGKVVYDISFTPPLSLFQTLIETQRPNKDWTISIFDSKGVNFARVPNPEQTIGQKASPTLYDALFKSREAQLNTVSLEGVALLTAFTRSNVTEWSVAAGIAEASLVGPLWRDLAITVSIGIIVMLIGIAFAIRMATSIARGEDRHVLMVEELNHRVKNTLALLQAMASQTFRTAPKSEKQEFDGRLHALAKAHDLLSEREWQGADVANVAQRVLQPYVESNPGRIRLAGPKAPLAPPRAVIMSMVLHELATNAAKYGALSNDSGRVTLTWASENKHLTMIWLEQGGPQVAPPQRQGLGSRLITSGVRDQLSGQAVVDYRPEGVVCTIECPLD